MDQSRKSTPNELDASDDSTRLASRLLVVGWDGVEVGALRSLLAQGRLPVLNSLINRGTSLELLAPLPAFPKAAWTSLATGKRPHEHAILHEFVPQANQNVLQPITRESRKCSTIWNILGSAGLVTHVIGWPVTHPAESLTGISVSDKFAQPLSASPSVPSEGSVVSPSEAFRPLIERRVSPAEAEEISLAQLLPAHAIGLRENGRLEIACRDILAQTATLFRALRWCLAAQTWNFAACVFPGIRQAHEIAHWLSGSSPAAQELSQHVISGCYEQHDLFLGQILSQVDESTHVLMISPAGVQTATSTRFEVWQHLSATCATARNNGLSVLAGPNVPHSTRVLQRSVLDIAPTILAMFELPIGEEMSGQPILELFETALSPATVKSWDLQMRISDSQMQAESKTAGEDVSSKASSNASVEHLVELGYVDPLDLAAQESMRRCHCTTEFNRAASLLDAGHLAQAIDVLKTLNEHNEGFYQARFLLAEALYRAGRLSEARQKIDSLRWQGYEHPQLYLLSAAIEFANRNFDLALEELACTRRGKKIFPGAALMSGNIYLKRMDFAAALAAFESSIDAVGTSAAALDGLSAVKLHLGKPDEAAMYALDAIELSSSLGSAHYHLGVALHYLNKPQEALGAFQNWATIEPRRAAPYRWMAHVYRRHLHNSDQAKKCLQRGKEVICLRRQTRENARGEGTSIPISVPSDRAAGR